MNLCYTQNDLRVQVVLFLFFSKMEVSQHSCQLLHYTWNPCNTDSIGREDALPGNNNEVKELWFSGSSISLGKEWYFLKSILLPEMGYSQSNTSFKTYFDMTSHERKAWERKEEQMRCSSETGNLVLRTRRREPFFSLTSFVSFCFCCLQFVVCLFISSLMSHSMFLHESKEQSRVTSLLRDWFHCSSPSYWCFCRENEDDSKIHLTLLYSRDKQRQVRHIDTKQEKTRCDTTKATKVFFLQFPHERTKQQDSLIDKTCLTNRNTTKTKLGSLHETQPSYIDMIMKVIKMRIS